MAFERSMFPMLLLRIYDNKKPRFISHQIPRIIHTADGKLGRQGGNQRNSLQNEKNQKSADNAESLPQTQTQKQHCRETK